MKSASPFAMTFMSGYSCGYEGYLPNHTVHPRSYEGMVTAYMPGTDVEVDNELTQMLKELKK